MVALTALLCSATRFPQATPSAPFLAVTTASRWGASYVGGDGVDAGGGGELLKRDALEEEATVAR